MPSTETIIDTTSVLEDAAPIHQTPCSNSFGLRPDQKPIFVPNKAPPKSGRMPHSKRPEEASDEEIAEHINDDPHET